LIGLVVLFGEFELENIAIDDAIP